MREHAPFHSQALNRSSSLLKKQLSICKSVSLSFLSNEPELVCSKAQMGISGPIQQQGVCYYNNWKLWWFLKGPKVPFGKWLWNKKLGRDGCRCRSWAPVPQPFPHGASPTSQQPWEQLGSAPLQEETIKPLELTLQSSAVAHSGLVLASTCGLCPLPQAVSCWMKEHRCSQRRFHIDFPQKGRRMSAESMVPTARTSNQQLPCASSLKVRAWCRQKRWGGAPEWDKRELITGLLPSNENKQHFEIPNTEGPKIQYLYLWHWQNHIQPGPSAIGAEVLFLHCLDWEQEIRGLQIRLGCISFTRQGSANPHPS